jgi:Protein of unknown function (DUF3237)
MASLERVLTYRLTIKGPLTSTAGSPLGERQYWEIADGTLSGDGLDARMALRGGDWMLVGPDGFWRPDVRVQFITSDGAVVLLHYTGLVKPTPAFLEAAERGFETQFEDQYLRQFMRFETGAVRYLWLTQHLFVGEGRLAGRSELEYRVYRVL